MEIFNEDRESASRESFDPWRTMWRQPRTTIRQVITRNPQYAAFVLLLLSGISEAIGRASLRNAGDKQDLSVILTLAVFGGIFNALFTAYIVAPALGLVGRWLNGKATIPQLRAALAWGSLPLAASLVLLLPELLIFGDEFFKSETPQIKGSDFLQAILLLFGIAEIVLGAWAVLLMISAVAEVQGFSIGKVLLNFLLVILLFVVAGVIFFLVIDLIR